MKKLLLATLFLITSLVSTASDWTKGKIVKVEPERHRVVLNHENIKSIGMEAMTMPFDTSPVLDLKNFKVGDSVRFQVKVNDGVIEIIALEKMP